MQIIVPQRNSLWGMSLCVWSLHALVVGVHNSDLKMMVFAGVLAGLMPQVQGHAFVAIAQWSVLFFLVSRMRDFWNWTAFGVVANVLGVPQVIPYLRRFAKANFDRINPIWNYGERKGPLVLWWRGLGVFGALAWVVGWVTASRRQVQVYLPSLGVWAIGNWVRYQLWEMDNIKVFYDGWIPVAVPFVAQFLVALMRRNGMPFALLLATSVLSGYVCIFGELLTPRDIFLKEDIEFGRWVAENTPVEQIFLTAQLPKEPTASLGGRQLFIGFVGWVVSHGIPEAKRLSQAEYLKAHPDDIDAFRRLGVGYVVESDFLFNVSGSHEGWELVYRDSLRKVWKLVG
jgi:hypothetical protein